MKEIIKNIKAARSEKKAELVLKNANIVNVFINALEKADVAIEDGIIVGIGEYEGETEIDLEGKYLCPGFIDGHIHIESSFLLPFSSSLLMENILQNYLLFLST